MKVGNENKKFVNHKSVKLEDFFSLNLYFLDISVCLSKNVYKNWFRKKYNINICQISAPRLILTPARCSYYLASGRVVNRRLHEKI